MLRGLLTSRVTNPTAAAAAAPVPGSSRARILEAATELFERDGFAETGVREIAKAAGVTPALVIRYYGSKEALFLLALTMEDGVAGVLSGPLATLGHDLVTFLLPATGPGEPGSGIFAALMRASDRPAVRASLLASLEKDVVGPLAPRLAGPDADLRARLVSACILGLLGSVELVGDTGVSGAQADRVAAHFGAAIQRLVDGPAC